jgi:SRSO17 transposase
MGITFDYIGADALYGNDTAFVWEIDPIEQIYMFDVYSGYPIYLQKPKLFFPECKTNKESYPKKLKASTDHTTAAKYIGTLQTSNWETIDIKHSAKGVLKGHFHFKTVYIWDKHTNTIETRLLVLPRRKTKNGVDIKYSFTNAKIAQYTEQVIACTQAKGFFVEHSFKEQKQILGLDQFQTRKWLFLYQQIALNMLVEYFMLKEKLLNQEEIPLLSARDIMDFLAFKFSREMTEKRMIAALKRTAAKTISR